MGNTQNRQDSSTTAKKSLAEIIDYVAANYILTQSFEDMKKLADMGYCNKLVILTSKIIANSLSNLEVEYLAQRLKGDEEVNYMAKDKVVYLNTENLPNLDVRSQTQKRRLCIGIAKHYVKVAHLFAAISTTINPTYSHTDASGQSITSTLAEKQYIPENVNVKINRINVCNERINALVNNQDFSGADSGTITVKPDFCQMNYNDATDSTKSLLSEPGIPELEKLYYDKYDYDHGNFIDMTDAMRADVYEKDVETFYKVFTGKEMPLDNKGKNTIVKFSQIPLKDFHKSQGCQPDGVYTTGYTGSLKDTLFRDYAEHVKNMMLTTTTNQDKLLAIIDMLFVFKTNILTNKKEIVVSPRLTEKKLQEIIEMSRKIIIELYITCEDDFLKGLIIFEAIVESQIIDTSKKQIKTLETNIEAKLASSDISETIKGEEVAADEVVADEVVAQADEATIPEEANTFESEVEKEIDVIKPTTVSLPVETTTVSLPVETTTIPFSTITMPLQPANQAPEKTQLIIPKIFTAKAFGGTHKKRRYKYSKKTRKH